MWVYYIVLVSYYIGIQETPIAADDVPSACENQTTPSQRISLSVGGVGMEGMDRGRVDVLCDGVSVSPGEGGEGWGGEW